jgi:hypothetical protein
MILCRVPEMTLGEVTVRNVRVSVIPGTADLPMLPEAGGRKIDMLLGYDLLRAFDWVEFQPAPRRIRLGAGVPFNGKASGVWIPLLEGGNRGPRVEARVNRGEAFPVTLDTGGHFGLRLPETTAKALGVARREDIPAPEARVGAGGKSATVKGEKVTLTLGALDMRNLPTHLHVGNEAVALKIGPMLGYPALSRIHWVLDHKNRRAVFYP